MTETSPMTQTFEKPKTLLIPSDFEKLAGQSNYTRWKLHIIDLLQHHDEWDVVSDAPKSSTPALQLLSLTVEYSVKDSYLENVARPLTSISMWNALKASLEPDSILLKTQLLTEIVNFNLELNSNSEESLIKLTKLMSTFNALTSKSFSGSELSLMMLYTKLPNELLSVRSTLMKNASTTFDSAKVSILQELRLYKAQESATGFMAKVKLCLKHTFRGRNYPVDKCFGCQPHLRPVCADCKAANFKEYYHKSGSFKCSQNKTVKVYSCISDRSSWFLDSGCTQHMSGAQWPSTNSRPSCVSITTASGHMQSIGTGTVQLGHLEITDTLFCPPSVPNLLSVSCLAKKNFITIFDDSGSITVPKDTAVVKFINQLRSQSIINSTLTDGLYKVSLGNTRAFISKTWTEAHEMLGHRHIDDLPRLSKLLNFTLIGTKPKSVCQDCAEGKMIRANIPKISLNNLTALPGEIFEADYQGPFSKKSYDNKNGNVKFVDVHSKYVFIKCLNGKNSHAIAEYFKAIHKRLLNQHNITCKTFRTDNGTEFQGSLSVYLREEGIIHKVGDAYKHHQPGCAERAHRSILEQAKTILLASKLPVIFYTAALEYSTYIINRIPRVGQSKSPYELLLGHAPSITEFIPFGSVVFAHDPVERRKNKLLPSGIRCRFLGYGDQDSELQTHKGLKLLREDNQQVIFSSDYILDLRAERLVLPNHPNVVVSPPWFTEVKIPIVTSEPASSTNSTSTILPEAASATTSSSPILSEAIPISGRTRSRHPLNTQTLRDVINHPALQDPSDATSFWSVPGMQPEDSDTQLNAISLLAAAFDQASYIAGVTNDSVPNTYRQAMLSDMANGYR